MKGIGEILTDLRLKKVFTQDQLADALDVKRARYNSWENNIAKPDIEMLKKIAKLHNVSTDYLLGRTDERTPSDKPEERFPLTADPLLDDLLKKVPNLTDEEKDSLAEHMQFALKIIEKERQKRAATKKDGDVS